MLHAHSTEALLSWLSPQGKHNHDNALPEMIGAYYCMIAYILKMRGRHCSISCINHKHVITFGCRNIGFLLSISCCNCGLVDGPILITGSRDWTLILPAYLTVTYCLALRCWVGVGFQNVGVVVGNLSPHVWETSVAYFYCISVDYAVELVSYWEMLIN